MVFIYKITNIATGAFYIGATNNIKRRKIQHFTPKRNGHSPEFDADIDKYGRNGFSFEVLEECPEEKRHERETYYIVTMHPTYNRSWKGQVMPVESRKKTSEAIKHWWKTLPEEVQSRLKSNLTGPRKGHAVSQETRDKISAKLKGIKQPPELIEKRRQGILARHAIHPQLNAGHRKKVLCDGIVFESVKACAAYLGMRAGGLSEALKKGRKAKGHQVQFVV